MRNRICILIILVLLTTTLTSCLAITTLERDEVESLRLEVNKLKETDKSQLQAELNSCFESYVKNNKDLAYADFVVIVGKAMAGEEYNWVREYAKDSIQGDTVRKVFKLRDDAQAALEKVRKLSKGDVSQADIDAVLALSDSVMKEVDGMLSSEEAEKVKAALADKAASAIKEKTEEKQISEFMESIDRN